MAKSSGKSQRLSLYNNSLNLAMSFYIAPYSLFPLHRHYYRCFSLYIQKKPSFFFCILPSLYIQCFPYSKNNTFLSIHFFCILPRLQCMFFLYIYGNQTFCPIKICVLLYIYIEERRFFLMYFIKVYSLYVYFPYIHRSIYLIYKPFLFLQLSPSPQYFCIQGKQCFYIQHCLDYGIFLIYIGKYCPFFSYISCHCISYRCFSIYISIKDTPFFFLFCPDSLYSFSSDCFLIYSIKHSFSSYILPRQ